VAVSSAGVTNGEFSGSSSSSTRPVSHDSTDAGAYAGSGDGAVSSGSVPYNATQSSSDAWNNRPASVHAGYTADHDVSNRYSSVVPASQRQTNSLHSNDVQEYDNSSCDFLRYFSSVFMLVFISFSIHGLILCLCSYNYVSCILS